MTGAEFIKIRKEMDLNQSQLAELMGLRQSTISQYESGKRRIYKHIEKLLLYICRDLNV